MMRFMPYPKPKSAAELEANRKIVLAGNREYVKKDLPMGGAAYFSEYDVAGQKRYSMVVFLGKSSKAYENVYYRTPEARQAAFDKYLENAKASEAFKSERKEARKPSNEGVKVGDIFVGSGGYDQTNVEALQVVELVGKSAVMVRPVGFEAVKGSDGFMCQNVKPVKDNFLDVAPPKMCPENPDYVLDVQAANRAAYYAGRGGLRKVIGGRIKSTWGSAGKWDGKSSYYNSWYA